jgi:hypothetical protein
VQRVRELYGEQAAQRARGDFDAVQIAVVRE